MTEIYNAKDDPYSEKKSQDDMPSPYRHLGRKYGKIAPYSSKKGAFQKALSPFSALRKYSKSVSPFSSLTAFSDMISPYSRLKALAEGIYNIIDSFGNKLVDEQGNNIVWYK